MSFSDTPIQSVPPPLPQDIFLLMHRDNGTFIPALDAEKNCVSFISFFSREAAEASRRIHFHKWKLPVVIVPFKVIHNASNDQPRQV